MCKLVHLDERPFGSVLFLAFRETTKKRFCRDLRGGSALFDDFGAARKDRIGFEAGSF